MERKLQTKPIKAEYSEFTDGCDLQSLLHPAQAFEHPSNVVTDPDLTLNEKLPFWRRGLPMLAQLKQSHRCDMRPAARNR